MSTCTCPNCGHSFDAPQEPVIGQKGGSIALEPFHVDFETIWAMYRRKDGKVAAFRKYVARRREGYSHEALYHCVDRYQGQETEARYLKHLATFFGPDRWFEQYLVATQDHTEVEELNGDRSIWDTADDKI